MTSKLKELIKDIRSLGIKVEILKEYPNAYGLYIESYDIQVDNGVWYKMLESELISFLSGYYVATRKYKEMEW